MEFSPFEFSFIDFTIIPLEDTLTMHLAIDKRTLVLSSFCFHDTAANFKITLECAFIETFSSFNFKSSTSLHIPILEPPSILFARPPPINPISILFPPIDKIALIDSPIRIYLFTFAIRNILGPITFIDKTAICWAIHSKTLEFAIVNGATFVWAIRVDIEAIISCHWTLDEWTLEVAAVWVEQFS